MDKDKKVKCEYCGKEVHEINLESHKEDCAKSPSIKGMEGWLVLLALGLYVLAINIFYYAITTPLSVFKILFFLDFAYNVYLIYLMHKKSKKFKELAFYGLWFWVPIIIIEIIYFVFTLTQEQFTEWINLFYINPQGIFSLFIITIVSLIWAIYLKESKRVKNTFVK